MAGKHHGLVLFAVFLLTSAVMSPVTSTAPKPTTHKTTSSPPPHNATTPKSTTPTPAPHNTTTPKPTTPTTAPHNTTTPKPTTPTTAPHNTTTPKPTTPTTAPHNTTTPKPTTPTTAPHNTTTIKPTTHTTAPHTTTSKPTTLPPTPTPSTNATVGNYTVKDGDKLCVMVQAVIEVNVNRSKTTGNYIVQPGTTKFEGKCDKTSANLNLLLTEGRISMTFTMNDTAKTVYVSSVAVNLTYAFKSGASEDVNLKNDSVQLFSMATSHSYSCKSESIFMGDGVSLKFSQNRMQAFNFTNNQFGPLDLCKADMPDYRVAVGVGVVLLILIIIVVLAYIISRRKRTDGYQSL